MIAARALLWVSIGAFSCAAWAQTPDCPKRGVPFPQRPPQIPQSLPPEAVFDAEEGHISAILAMERAVRKGAVPAESAAVASDVAKTPLEGWTYVGYLPSPSPRRVSRFFRSPEGALLAFGEWDYRADVGDAPFSGMDNAAVAGKPAGTFSLRSPTGCVSTTLSWKDDRKLYRLEIVGPLDMASQRAQLMRIAESIAR